MPFGASALVPIIGVVCLVALILVAVPPRVAGQSGAPHTNEFSRIADDYFAPLLSGKRLNGAVVVITNREKPIFAKSYGPVDLDRTLWRAGSVSKALTAIAVMRLVEQHKVISTPM